MHRKTLYKSGLASLGATAAAVAVTVGAGAGTGQAATGHDDGWQPVGKGMTGGASGIATSDHPTHGAADGLVVRDSKKPGENRMARVVSPHGGSPYLKELDWRGEVPTDLEALDKVPGKPGEYVALASAGTAYHVQVSGGAAKVLDTFSLPRKAKDDNYENFALAAPPASSPAGRDGKLVAVWADRGDDSHPSTARAATLSLGPAGDSASGTPAARDAGRPAFGDVDTARVRAPYPAENIRHASDLEITKSGALLVSSASDPGDDGPFDSAVYEAGHVSLDGKGGARLHPAKDPEALKKFTGHKIEALACLPNSGRGKAVLGTDDENGGGALTTASGLCDR